jgi:hypothetical protein
MVKRNKRRKNVICCTQIISYVDGKGSELLCGDKGEDVHLIDCLRRRSRLPVPVRERREKGSVE